MRLLREGRDFMDAEDKKKEKITGEIFGGDNVIRVRGARQNNLQNLYL